METYRTDIKPKLGWVIIAFLSLVGAGRWLMIQTENPLLSSYTLFSDIGKVLGIVGILLYAINLILSTRMRILDDFFGGLNKTYIAHHIVGGIALIALLFHPLFLALRYIDHQSLSSIREAAIFLLPRAVPFGLPKKLYEIQNLAINDGIIAFLGMVVLLFLTFFVKLPYRIWLFTHKFLGVAFFFAGLHVLFINSDTSRDPLLKNYILGITFLGLLAFLYRTVFGKILIRTYKYRLESVSGVGVETNELVMRPVGANMDYQPGQFVFIRFRNSGDAAIGPEAHPFSISSAPGNDHLRITVKALGDYTRSLLALKPGVIAEIEGAFGKFSYKNFSNPNQVWIAGGIGITPFLSMAGSLDQIGPKVDLYYSVKDESELIDIAMLETVMKSRPDTFRLIPFISNKQGFLTADFINKQSGDLASKDIFICGPPVMMKAMRMQLRALQVPNIRIHSEEFAML